MTRIAVMTTTSLANVKARLSAFVTSVHDTHERVTITRNGEPAAVLIAPDDLESLEETISILSDPATMAALAEGQRDVETGNVIPFEDFLRERGERAE